MQIIRYKSSSGITLGMSHNGQLIGYFQQNPELHDLLRLRADELRVQIENSRPPVYAGKRPELFFKATARRVAGPGAPIVVRSDSTWDVPEPELVLAVNAHAEIIGYAIGNDVSSRSIEGENPLYLPQAKVYA